MDTFYRWLTEGTSQKWISQTTGKLTKSSLSKRWIPAFAKTYGIRVEEAEKALNEYRTLNEFFTRRLKPGLRKIDEMPNSIVSSVDALITGMGEIQRETEFAVKGQLYTVPELLDDAEEAKRYMNGKFVVLYLSPTDYHRIHAPIDGELVHTKHVLGKVYPVNDFGLRKMNKVLSRNERLISYIRNKSTQVAVVKVGALNVSSIQMSDQITSNQLKKGQELAYFEFGSTVVLLLEGGRTKWAPGLAEDKRILLGEPIAYVSEA
jgi:phosphatidylserine decarboxylase